MQLHIVRLFPILVSKYGIFLECSSKAFYPLSAMVRTCHLPHTHFLTIVAELHLLAACVWRKRPVCCIQYLDVSIFKMIKIQIKNKSFTYNLVWLVLLILKLFVAFLKSSCFR